MKVIEMEERYLGADIGDISQLTANRAPDLMDTYCNFTFDYFLGESELCDIRSQRMTLRARLLSATESDVATILAEAPSHRFEKLLSINKGRTIEYTLKTPAAFGSKQEIVSINEIAAFFGRSKNIHTAQELVVLFREQNLCIFGAMLTERTAWACENIDDSTELTVTRDRSRCQHQITSQETGRDIVEIEALVHVDAEDNEAQMLEQVEKKLADWTEKKLGTLPTNVIGSTMVCIANHTPHIARTLFQKGSFSKKRLAEMVRMHELSEARYLEIITPA